MRATIPLLVAILLAACERTEEVPWEIRSADPSALESAAIIETTVRRGGCEGVLIYRESIAPDRPGPRPQVGRGLHGFAAEVRDAECRPLVRGCIERDLPLRAGERVELVLERVLPTAACAASACVEGTCTDRDAGAVEIDDAGMHDAGVEDAGAPVDQDAGTPDDGGTVDEDGGIEIDAGPLPAECDGTEWSGHCYSFRSTTRDWSTAEAACVAWRGHLASLGGPDEEAFVRGLASGAAYWIGLNDLTVEDIFTWVDGSSSSHRHWGPGEPSGNPQAHCVLDEPTTDGWALRRCRDLQAYVCER
ncbi:C-type lectin domain-containing protein [Sandaracinus amylolyticus]|uniref:C-type lectin domain-containing protein n=1 Tax=Sandaracinus amylolyticus TaxID=927083 RepID=UPI001F167BFF|nr:C-type lectin domain-containing protein [Sandaracinus amylolyticus]